MLVLGIESSCDETAASIVEDGSRLISSVVSSQIMDHSPFGGVVPEIASRKHLEAVSDVVDKAFREADLAFDDVDGVAVTQGPGLIGSLLVGFSFAKAFAYAGKFPWVGVNHLHGHMMSVFLEKETPVFPYISLLASGGHTSIYLVKDYLHYDLLGSTRDDAAGEAYDKIAKMLGFPYPGGQIIDDLSLEGDKSLYKFPRAWLQKGSFDFSFSGLKSAVRRVIEKIPENELKENTPHIAASFQDAVTDVLVRKTINAAKVTGCNCIAICGGVAANAGLRKRFSEACMKENFEFFSPSLKFCSDNAAMIACAGYHKLKNNIFSDMNEEVYARG